MDKPNLLIVGDYNRSDFLSIFKDSLPSFHLYFAEFASRNEVSNKHYETYGNAVFWGDYASAQQLVEKIRPKKVIFFFIESYYHVALNIVCKLNGIPTYHIDHGIRDVNVNIRLEDHIHDFKQLNGYQLLLKKLAQFLPRVRARFYLLNTIRLLPIKEATVLREYIKIRRSSTYRETIKVFDSHYRLPDAYISFSPKTHEVHQHYDKITENKSVHFIGLPQFDHLAHLLPLASTAKTILFIEQGLAFRNFYGWTLAEHSKFTSKLAHIVSQAGYNLKVKLHPRQPEAEYRNWQNKSGVEIISDEAITDLLPGIRLVAGFFSTYMLPIIALTHTTLITIENHPAGRLDVSKSFIDAGVSHPVYDLNDLPWALEHIEELHQRQLPNKKKFEEEWLYKFDGKAGERLRNILLSDDL